MLFSLDDALPEAVVADAALAQRDDSPTITALGPRVSEPLEGEVLEEGKHRLPPHQDEGWLMHLEYAIVDELDGVPERTTGVRLMQNTYVLPVESRSGFCSSRL